MLTYNTQQPKLTIAEYGRVVQQMVDHCMTIENREERNRCARTIIGVMRKVHPQTGDPVEIEHKLWDHLAIMSNFALDVDYPFEVVKADEIHTKPEPVKIRSGLVSRRIYGKNIERLIDVAAAMQPGDERNELILLIANQMKKIRLDYNPDGVTDDLVFTDLDEMSHGELHLDPGQFRLNHYQLAELPVAKKKRKKKR